MKAFMCCDCCEEFEPCSRDPITGEWFCRSCMPQDWQEEGVRV